MHKFFLGLLLMVTAIPASVIAASSDSASLGLSLRVALVCRAEILSTTVTSNAVRVEIKELCNGGTGYELELHHDGVGVRKMVYDDAPVTYDGSAQTVLATRNGAYHGRRTLVIETTGTTPQIFDVAVRRSSPRL